MRPHLLNRFDAEAHDEFIAALAQVAAAGESVRALIIAADGKVFSAGGDFDEMLEANRDPSVRARMADQARAVMYGLVDLPIPVIAAVQGAAVGLGATIAGLADIVVAWRGAKIADTHVNVGLVAGDGGIISWAQSVGLNRAKRHLLTGDPLTAEEAFAAGLVTDLVDEPSQALPAARAIAERIKSLPPAGVNGTKKAFATLTRARVVEAFETGLELEMQSMASPNLAAVIVAMKAKRERRD